MHRTSGPRSAQRRASMARSTALLLWAQALGLAGSQLTVDPPWTPVFVKEKVTLRCQGPGPVNWYQNGQLLGGGPVSLSISKVSPTTSRYQCHSHGASLSPPVTLSFSNDWLVLQVPTRALVEGDAVSLRCRAWQDEQITQVRFYREREALGGPPQGSELLLSPLQLRHRGRYRCQATINSVWAGRKESVLVTVTVRELFSGLVLRLEGPAEPLEGTPLLLGCDSILSPLRPHTRLQHLFYRDEVVVGGPQESPQLWLRAVALADAGRYSCEVRTDTGSVQKRSAPVTVTVHRVPVSGVSLVAEPPDGQVVEGDRLVLGCGVAAGTGPLSFSWHRQGLATPLATGASYELRVTRHENGSRYHCTASNGGTAADSAPLRVTVLVPVANVTITTSRMEPSVLAGESLNLSCSVQEGTAPVTFTWLQNGQELGKGPVLALGTVRPAHAGTYQCLATNHLGAHRVFQAHSAALNLSVTQPEWWPQGRVLAVGLSVSLLLLLLLGAAVTWHLWRRHPEAAGNNQGRDPTAPPQPEGCQLEPTAPPGAPENEEVLYSNVMVIERGAGTSPSWAPHLGPPPESPVIYAVLSGPPPQCQPPSDIYENIP